jgi:hypothetical protein
MAPIGLMRTHVTRTLAIACALLAFAGCAQIQLHKCVRDMVNSNEPYPTQADRDDSEALAKQLCLRKAAAGGSR